MDKIAITFDDAPEPYVTNEILSILEKNNIKATFFIQGNKVKTQGSILDIQRMKDMGCQIGNHTWSHLHFLNCSTSKIQKEIKKTDILLSHFGVKKPIIRTPYGEWDDRIERVLRKRKNILWDVHSKDSDNILADEIIENVLGKVKDGDIILFHAWSGETLKALPAIISELKGKYKFATIDELKQEGIFTVNYNKKLFKRKESGVDKLVKFIDLYWPIEYCNLSCPYCYINQHRENKRKKYQCSHSPAEIRKALSKRRLGGQCFLNICAGGETLLEESIVPIIYELLKEGHYVGIVTNGLVTKNILLLCEFPEGLRKHLFLKFSFHYGELKRVGKLESYFETIKMVKEKGISFTLELPAYDELIPENKKIIQLCKDELGAAPHVATLRDETKPSFSVMSKY